MFDNVIFLIDQISGCALNVTILCWVIVPLMLAAALLSGEANLIDFAKALNGITLTSFKAGLLFLLSLFD